MHENYISNNKIKENKYKILRMSLILGSDDNREDTINNFEESAREIDAMNDETYLNEIESKFYDTLKLEEEEKKLAVLVDYIGGRVEQRISLLSDFANITGYDLSNLPPIKYYDKLDDYKERLKYIREYLNNTDQINKLTIEIEEADTKLKESYDNKQTSEEANARNEDALLNKFTSVIKTSNYLQNIDINNIDSTLNSVISSVEESKKSLDIFTKSYTTLKGSGINYEEELEYKSYVDNAKDIFYSNKEQEYLLKIYKLLLNKETEYVQIVNKRDEINAILAERMELRGELEIEDNDILNPLYDLLEIQYLDIESQKNNIEAIEYLNELIEIKKNEKNDLEQANQKVEILSLLREFCIIDTYTELEEQKEQTVEETEVTSENVDDISNKTPETTNSYANEEISVPLDLLAENKELPELKTEETVQENQVVNVEDATNLDLELIQSKANKVMKRVGEMLGIIKEETELVNVTNEEENTKEEKVEEQPLIENPLFTETLETSSTPNTFFDNMENPLFNNELSTINTNSVDPEDDNNFWFPSDTPDALNDLPDLEVSNENFFGDNNMPDLNFPDLKLDFGQSDTEDK